MFGRGSQNVHPLFCQTPVLVLRLGVDFILPLSQEEQKEHEQEQQEQVYQPSGARGTRSLPATPHRLQHLTARLIQNG